MAPNVVPGSGRLYTNVEASAMCTDYGLKLNANPSPGITVLVTIMNTIFRKPFPEKLSVWSLSSESGQPREVVVCRVPCKLVEVEYCSHLQCNRNHY